MNLPNANRVELPPRMRATLEEYRKRVWIVKIAEGLLAAVFGLVISYLVVLVLDRFWDTSAMLRGLSRFNSAMFGWSSFMPRYLEAAELECHDRAKPGQVCVTEIE